MATQQKKRTKLHIKKGDRVRVIAGNSRGNEGRVLRVFPETERVIIEGVNLRIRHTRPNQQHPNGGRIQKEMPVHVSNVMPLDRSGNPTRIGRKRIENPETGKSRWIRYAKTTGEELDR